MIPKTVIDEMMIKDMTGCPTVYHSTGGLWSLIKKADVSVGSGILLITSFPLAPQEKGEILKKYDMMLWNLSVNRQESLQEAFSVQKKTEIQSFAPEYILIHGKEDVTRFGLWISGQIDQKPVPVGVLCESISPWQLYQERLWLRDENHILDYIGYRPSQDGDIWLDRTGSRELRLRYWGMLFRLLQMEEDRQALYFSCATLDMVLYLCQQYVHGEREVLGEIVNQLQSYLYQEPESLVWRLGEPLRRRYGVPLQYTAHYAIPYLYESIPKQQQQLLATLYGMDTKKLLWLLQIEMEKEGAGYHRFCPGSVDMDPLVKDFMEYNEMCGVQSILDQRQISMFYHTLLCS